MQWLSNLNDIAGILSAAATIALTWIIYRYTRKREQFESTSQVQNEWQFYNQIAISDPEILEMDARAHPFGTLDAGGMKRLNVAFLKLNIAYNTWSGGNGHVDRKVAESSLNNVANTLYADRSFIRVHALPRGYPVEFAQMMERKWSNIEQSGKPLPMS
jgi:hypothetical protein